MLGSLRGNRLWGAIHMRPGKHAQEVFATSVWILGAKEAYPSGGPCNSGIIGI